MPHGHHDDDHSPERGDDPVAPSSPASSLPNEMTLKDQQNYFARFIEDGKSFAPVPEAGVVGIEYERDPSAHAMNDASVTSDIQLGIIIGNLTGLLGGTLLHKYLVWSNGYKPARTPDPIYRVFKTTAYAATILATLTVNLLPVPNVAKKLLYPILTGVFCVLAGIFSLVYYQIHKNEDPEKVKKETYCTIGPDEGWTKNLKSASVGGAALGPLAGLFYFLLCKGTVALSTCVYLGMGFGGIGLFLGAAILIPFINWISEQRLGKKVLKIDQTPEDPDAKDKFRNNYVRSGMTLGTGIGSIIGFFVGTFLFPGIGSVMGSVIGGGLFSIIGGVVLGITGQNISKYLRDKWNVPFDTSNSWDYSCRTTSFALGPLGSLIGAFIDPQNAIINTIGTFSLGNAIASTIGWFLGFPIIYRARQVHEEDPKKKGNCLPWTQRIPTGMNVVGYTCSAIGAIIGMAIGGPLAAAGLGALCYYGSSIVGGIIGAFYGAPEAREVIKKAIDPNTPIITPKNSPPSSPTSITRSLSRSNSESGITAGNGNKETKTPPAPTPASAQTAQKVSALRRNSLTPPPPHNPAPKCWPQPASFRRLLGRFH